MEPMRRYYATAGPIASVVRRISPLAATPVPTGVTRCRASGGRRRRRPDRGLNGQRLATMDAITVIS
ncbi:MAG: hypothetical protein AVDCRST_MAG70-1655 [uncultured Thermomicrobiales bacterium]|uniref:Uncharacterized protein n=1 Tax=uncultured Thermomicrobiales bacterium TaxID=1645740 RepID=A0A6J4UXJ2_9BACT|nr:MAG: hypothetical protein AVDCRST_MAG70-1655 [uncultured Thermomicrobiales bacterium]